MTLRKYAIVFQETFGAVRTVRSFAQEDYEISRYSQKVDETLQLGLSQAVSCSSCMLLTHSKDAKMTTWGEGEGG